MPRNSPPIWADRLLRKLVPDQYEEEMVGDFYEAFYWRLDSKGSQNARWMFIWEVIRLIRFSGHQTQNNSNIMLLTNYLKTGIRFLWKTRSMSSLNIAGLAIGLAVAWMSLVYVSEETSFDRFHENKDRIYRVVSYDVYKDREFFNGGGSYMMGEELPKVVPGIESFSRIRNGYGLLVEEANSSPTVFHYADPGLFEMLTFDFQSGEPFTKADLDVAVLSRSVAERLEKNGKYPDEITIYRKSWGQKRFKVGGVYADFPANATVAPDIIIPMEQYAIANPTRLNNWFDINMNVMVMLGEQVDPYSVEQNMTIHVADAEDFSDTSPFKMSLQPITDIHTNSQYETGNGLKATADIELIWIVVIIGLFCLTIACINFANFAVGNYFVRVKEVGVRKVLGAKKHLVFYQFVVETGLAAMLAGFLSLVIIALIIPVFSDFTGKSYSILTFFQGQFWLGGLGLLVLLTVMAGVYPAVVLAKFNITSSLNGRAKLGTSVLANNVLIIVQFTLAAFLITGMMVFDRQLDHILSFDRGYETENIISVWAGNSEEEVVIRTKREFEQIPGVEKVTMMTSYNGTDYGTDTLRFSTRHNRVDANFIDVLGLELVAGRNFDPSSTSDMNNAAIINEALAKKAGLVDPVGKMIPFEYGDLKNPVVIGVIKDYHFLDLEQQVGPLVIYMSPQNPFQNFLIKGQTNNVDFIDAVDAKWRESFAPYPFEYSSLDQLNRDRYELEAQIHNLARSGAIIAIFLAGLGLMGVVGTHVRQKIKEVCIRKINGASPQTIFVLFLKKYLIMTISGLVIGVAVAYSILGDWLERYIIQIQLGWEIVFVVTVIVATVAGGTIFGQLAKPMYVNPVKYLRDE